MTYLYNSSCILLYGVVILILAWAACYNGLIIYAAFHDCDPLTIKIVAKDDQLLLYYVIRLMKSIPGIPGIFVSAIVCAALT